MHRAKKHGLAWIGLALGSLLLFGCSNGSSHSGPSTGTFVDSAVEGLSYTAGTLTGVTNADGEFQYHPGSTVTFRIGDLVLGSAASKKTLTPVDLSAGAENADDAILNIARLLISLDEDGDPSNGITITAATAAAVSGAADEGASVDFDVPTADFEIDALLAAAETDLVGAGTACAHLQESLGIDLCEDTLEPALGAPLEERYAVVFSQNVPIEDDDGGVFPNMANYWDLNSDFSLSDGWNDQFDGALRLSVGEGDGGLFPKGTYEELTYYTPLLDAADGVVTAVVASDEEWWTLSGTYSAILNSGPDSRLQQTLDLTEAAAPIALAWLDDASACTKWGDEPAYYRVVLRDPADGSVLATALPETEWTWGPHDFDLSALAGQSAVLSFEFAGSWDCVAGIDDVSVIDNGGEGSEFVVNGDFETGDLTGWTANAPQVSQNVTSGVRTLGGLDVTRSFYTVPNKLWGRWVDVFENSGESEVVTTVTYETDLGSDDAGIIYLTPGTDDMALTTWDGGYPGRGGDRDIGMVFGATAGVDFISDDGFDNCNGSDMIYHGYEITVPAGGKVAIVNFIVMNGVDTSLTAEEITARATAIDAENAAIVENFWTDPQYRDGMTQEQIDAIVNFPLPGEVRRAD